MNRRGFIKVIGVGIGGAALASTAVGCRSDVSVDDFGWSGPSDSLKDIRLQAISYAILAPNPHNKQPWIIRMTSANSFELYVDPERLLPETDPYYRQIHIGQGTFLEMLSIAATGLGHRANIEYFPQGEYSNSELHEKPIAAIELIPQPGIAVDPLFAHLLERRSNKRNYDNKPLTATEVSDLKAFYKTTGNYSFTVVQDKESKAKLSNILTQSMSVEVADKARDRETIAMFRFNPDEVEKYRDGFGLAQSGTTGFKKILIENLFLSRSSVEKDPTDFGLQAIEIVKNSAESTHSFAWLTTKGNSRLDQVKVGREYCRLNIKTTAMGLAQHPMSQVLQEYSDMLPIQAEFKQVFSIAETETVQMLFRLGRAEDTAHSPRRLVTELVRS